jgi:hypothetical protein
LLFSFDALEEFMNDEYQRRTRISLPRLLDGEEKALASALKDAQRVRADAEYSRALERFDAANLAAEGALRDFYESALRPLADEAEEARTAVRRAEGEYRQRRGINWNTSTLQAPDHHRPCNSVRFILGALERWSKGEPL